MVHAGTDDNLNLVIACRSGDPAACRRLAHQHQRDLLRAGYLLTGRAGAADRLARETLLGFFRDGGESPDLDPRQLLLGDLAWRYLRTPRQRGEHAPSRPADRYAVDDERQRLVAAFELLDPATRAAIVLSDFGALAGKDVAQATGMSRFEAGERVERARARLIDAAGRRGASTGTPIYDLLGIVARDAPSDDLWPEIEPLLREHHARQRRRSRLITAGAIGAATLALVAALIWLGGFDFRSGERDESELAAAPTPSPTASPLSSFLSQPVLVEPSPVEPALPAAMIPDLQLISAVEQGGTLQSALLSYDPIANTTEPLLDAGSSPLISPDGQWLVARRPNPDASGELLLTGRSLAGQGGEWQVSVPDPRAATLSSSAVYLLTSGGGELAIRAYDITSGAEMTGEPVPVEGIDPGSRVIRLFASPDGEMLHVLASQVLRPLGVWSRSIASFQTDGWIPLEPLTHIVEPSIDRWERDFDIGDALPAPDGQSLYSIITGVGAERLKLQFLDLISGRVSSVELPFSAFRTEFAPRGYHAIPSNTGRMLYVLQTERREVAIVDLVERKVEAVFRIDPGDAAGNPTLETVFRFTTYVVSAFSPDGTTLYLANVRTGNDGVNAYTARSPVWVIDTSAWRIIDRYEVPGRPRALTISGDGSQVYVRSTRPDGQVMLTGFDTTSGETIANHRQIPAPEWATIQRLTSLSDLYRRQHARSPATAGVEPEDNLNYEMLPTARIDPEGDLVPLAGAATTLVVRMIDPLTGSPLGSGDNSSMRYDPGASVALSLTHESGSGIVIFPWQDGPGVYRAPVTLAEAGWWDARITVINRDGSTWSIDQPRAIEAVHPFRLASGDVYGLRVRPDAYVNQRTLTVRVQPVHPETGRRARELGDLSGMPESLDLAFTHESGEQVTVTLDRMDDGTFIGWTSFVEAGRWDVAVSFAGPGDATLTIAAEPIQIRELSEPWQRGGDAAGTGNPWTSRPESM